jgi:colanic acid biosynthesis glycosyl transferase WcaI
MRILLLSQWFEPEPFFKGLPFAKALKESGHEVEVVTGFPNYPDGNVYPGYRIRIFQRELIDGIPILRVPIYPSHDRGSFRRILNYSSFALSASIIGTMISRQADVVYVYHPPGTVGLPALMMKLFRKTPYVYDIQDLWPESVEASGMIRNRVLLRLIDYWCRLVYYFADRIVVQSPGFKEALMSKRVPGDKIDVVYNWCDDRDIPNEAVDENLAGELGLKGHFNILFAGTMGRAQDLEAVLDAAEIINKQQSDIQFVFIGGGTEADHLRDCARKRKITNAVFLKRRPVSQIWGILGIADVLLVHLSDILLYQISIPSKTQAYMAAGKPILMGVKGDAASLVVQAKAGLVCLPGNPVSIAEIARKLYLMTEDDLRELGGNGKLFYERYLSREVGVKAFERVFKEVINSRSQAKEDT